jgi:hypothetical protein
MDRVRSDPDLLDDDAPFEIDDDNGPISPSTPRTPPPTSPPPGPTPGSSSSSPPPTAADWLLVARLPGGVVVQVPLAPPRSGGWRTCRPVGIYQASAAVTRRYHEENR